MRLEPSTWNFTDLSYRNEERRFKPEVVTIGQPRVDVVGPEWVNYRIWGAAVKDASLAE